MVHRELHPVSCIRQQLSLHVRGGLVVQRLFYRRVTSAVEDLLFLVHEANPIPEAHDLCLRCVQRTTVHGEFLVSYFSHVIVEDGGDVLVDIGVRARVEIHSVNLRGQIRLKTEQEIVRAVCLERTTHQPSLQLPSQRVIHGSDHGIIQLVLVYEEDGLVGRLWLDNSDR